MTVVNWDCRFLELAKHIAEWSHDPNAKIGAVIVNSLGQVISVGTNGFPQNVEETENRVADKTLKNQMTVHAETNAIMIAGSASINGTIYVAGKPTCSDCAGAIIQAGIRKVISAQPQTGTASKWDKSGLISLEMFVEAGVEFVSNTSIGTKPPVSSEN